MKAAHTVQMNSISALAEAEAEELAGLEDVIERGLKTFYEVGRALIKIRDRRLYRAEFATWEDYCQQRWRWGPRRAQQLMAAADIMQNLTATVLPTTESQVRALAAVPEEERRQVWDEAVRTAPGGIVTAKHVAYTVQTWKVQQELESAVERDRRDRSGLESGPNDNQGRLTPMELNPTSRSIGVSPASPNDQLRGDDHRSEPEPPDPIGETERTSDQEQSTYAFELGSAPGGEKEISEDNSTTPVKAKFSPVPAPKSAKLQTAELAVSTLRQLMDELGMPRSVAHDLTGALHKVEAIKGWLEDQEPTE